ncbi:MAG: cytidylate kinase-like family protein [Deltaproteobacteria bacterium]|nr:cytidylate kinase-like family protein [Deltaproteobacteria bacterium]
MAVLSISRQFGAGGKTLGEMVAKRLGYTFVDEAILHKMAEKANVSVRWVEAVEKELGGRLMRFISQLVPSSFIERHVGESGADFDEKKYKEFAEAVVREVADQDDVVILGRGSQFILRDRFNTVRVLLVAEAPDRIKFMMDNYQLDENQARNMVAARTRMRERFLKEFYPGDANDPSLYHMVINTSQVPLDIAEAQIEELVLGTIDRVTKPIWD